MTNQTTETETFKVQPSYVIMDISAASGGVTYTRETLSEHEINDGDGEEREWKTNKRTDHKELCQKADALRSKAAGILRRRCAYTAIGWICEENQLIHLREDFRELQVVADLFNQRAAQSWCARRVRIGFVPVKLEIDNEAAAQEIARTIRETLRDMKTRLEGGCTLAQWGSFFQSKVKNLDKLAAGMQKFSITAAIDCAKAARAELKVAQKAEREPELDLEAIDAAIGMFSGLELMADTLDCIAA